MNFFRRMGIYQSIENSNVTSNQDMTECKFKYTISNFKGLTLPTGSSVTSKKIIVENIDSEKTEWELVFYPKGYNERTANYMSLWLKKISLNENLVQFTCEIQRANIKEENIVQKTIKKKLDLETFLGWSAFCKRSHIIENETEVLKNGKLTFICTIEIYKDKFISNAAIEDEDPGMDARLLKLSDNFKDLLLNNRHYDVTFEIKAKTFYAHKAVLAARSPVFRAMFDLQTFQVNAIPVSDINEDTFEALLLFIYSGECVQKDFDGIFNLYYAADKYEILSLRRFCCGVLMEKMELENAIDIANLANKHNDKILKDAAIHFISRNAKDIQEREEWLELVKSSPRLANSVFKSLTHLANSIERQPSTDSSFKKFQVARLKLGFANDMVYVIIRALYPKKKKEN